MLRLLGEAASERKLRLFACCSAELAWRSMLQRDVPAPLELAWAAADDSSRESELSAEAPKPTGPASAAPDLAEWFADQALEAACRPQGARSASQARHAVEALAVRLAADNEQDTASASQEARTALASFLRDIFGNPFRPVMFPPDWRTDTTVALAHTMYDSRDFSAMPILADALQDAGCPHEDVLNHCRFGGVHVRGCWVVDLVLGRG